MLVQTELDWIKEQNVGELIKVDRFNNALTNDVFLITNFKHSQFIFKRLNQQARSNKDRQAEVRVQHLASEQGLTAKVIVSNNSYKLQQYIPGDLMPIEVNNLSELLATQFQRIHNLPALHAPKQRLAFELQRLKIQLPVSIDEKVFTEMFDLAEQLDSTSPCDTLCHGDLSLNNVLQGDDNKVYILDWEYDVIACVAYDLAFCNCINEFTEAQSQALISSYYRQITKAPCYSLKSLQKECQLYLKLFSYINELWVLCFIDKD